MFEQVGLAVLVTLFAIGGVVWWRFRAIEEKEYQEEIAYWQDYQAEVNLRRATLGARWAHEDFNRWQEGEQQQGLPLGTPLFVRRSYYRTMDKLEFEHVQELQRQEVERRKEEAWSLQTREPV